MEDSVKTFSEVTKEELCKSENKSNCCNRAEFMGMLLFGSTLTKKNIKFVTENPDVLKTYIDLSQKMNIEPLVRNNSGKTSRLTAEFQDEKDIIKLLNGFNVIDFDTGIIKYKADMGILQKECCRRAFIKGAFLSGGTVIDPKKNYNLEIITPYLGLSRDMQQILDEAGFGFKAVMRKSKYVLYLKNSEAIVDFLTYMGAFKAQMEYINIKIEKEIRNDMVRAINSETANIEKTINASVEQVKAIEEIDRLYGLDSLSEELKNVAMLRLKHKNLSLSELGKLINPPLSKSGVNHRIKKIMELANRNKK